MRKCDLREEGEKTFSFASQRNFELGSSSRCGSNSDGGCLLSLLSLVVIPPRWGTSRFWNELFSRVL